MHPILATRGRLGLYLAVWILAGGLLAAVLARSGGLTFLEAVAIALPLALVYAFTCLAAWYLCRTMPLGESGVPRLLGSHAVAAAVSSALWLLVGRGWVQLLSVVVPFPDLPRRWGQHTPLFFVAGILLFLLAVAVHYLMIAFEASRLAETRALELKVYAREAELKALRAQIDPHFLFNSLHSISALTTTDPDGARRMCIRLGDFLRSSLALGAKERISLAEELSLLEHFLAIEKVRFGHRLTVDQQIDQGVEDCLIPPLLLQPLVENAVTHGIADLVDGGVVRVEAKRRNGRLEIAVDNPCDPDLPRRAGAGVGLQNVKMRLETLYGREARMDVEQRADRFRVELTLPWITAGSGLGSRDRPAD